MERLGRDRLPASKRWTRQAGRRCATGVPGGRRQHERLPSPAKLAASDSSSRLRWGRGSWYRRPACNRRGQRRRQQQQQWLISGHGFSRAAPLPGRAASPPPCPHTHRGHVQLQGGEEGAGLKGQQAPQGMWGG